MTQLEFLHGHPFKYKGGFQRLERHVLFYDPQVQQVIDEDAKEEWPVSNITEKGYMLFKNIYGNLRIEFNECTVYVAPAKKN